MARGPHIRVTLEGVYGSAASPLEIWRTGVNVNSDSSPAPDNTFSQETPAAIYAAFVTAYMGNVQATCVLTACDVRFIGADGRQPKDSTGAYLGQYRYEQNTPGTISGGVQLPFQVAMVASLFTARAGAEGRGRMFLPTPGFPVQPDGRLESTIAPAVAEQMAGFVAAVNTRFEGLTGGTGKVSVMSSKGFASTVTAVRCGTVLDTQRRRRGDLLEGYSVNKLVANA